MPEQGEVAAETWTTEDGRVIAIHDLSDSHLVNIVRFLQARAEEFKAQHIQAISAEILVVLQGEMAQEAAFAELDARAKRPALEYMREASPQYRRLLQEIAARDLERCYMTARRLIYEMQLHIVKHPEALDWPVRFLGYYNGEDGTGAEICVPEMQTVSRVALDVRKDARCFTLNGE